MVCLKLQPLSYNLIISIYLSEAEEFPEDWTESPLTGNHRSITGDRNVEEEDVPYQSPTNDLDARASTDSQTLNNNNNTHHQQLPPQSDSQDGRTTEPDEFHPNIPASQEDEVTTGYPDHNPTNPGESTINLLQTTAQILKQSGYDSEGCSVPYPIWREDYYPENGHGRNNCKVPPPIPKRTTPPITRPSKLVNGLDVNGGGGIYYAPEEVLQGSTTRSATLPRKKLQENEQQQQQQPQQPPSRGLEKKLYKKLTQRKTSLQNALANNKYPRPPSLSLLTAVCRKLEDEGIDLGQEPYTDKVNEVIFFTNLNCCSL